MNLSRFATPAVISKEVNMQQIILIFHLLFAVALIAIVLVQQGKGATMGASFGAGASQTVFGSQGYGSFLMKVTGGLALLFFATSLILGFLTAREVKLSHNNSSLSAASQMAKTIQQPKQAATPQNLKNKPAQKTSS
jgi:preprotein translocase subunit SecG